MHMKTKNEEMYEFIVMEIKSNREVTEKYLAEKYNFSERTIRRYIKDLKDNKKIILNKKGNLRYWQIL